MNAIGVLVQEKTKIPGRVIIGLSFQCEFKLNGIDPMMWELNRLNSTQTILEPAENNNVRRIARLRTAAISRAAIRQKCEQRNLLGLKER